MDDSEDVEPSLDQLSQAFAAAMGRENPAAQVDAKTNPDATETAAAHKSRLLPGDACPICPKSILESVLFVGHPENEPVQAQRVAAFLRGVQSEEIDDLVRELNAEYESQAMPFTIQPAGDGYLLELKPEFQHIRDRFYGTVREAKLSQLAVDVLAIVAYNQPIARDELEKLLNVTGPIQRVLNQLIRRDLLARRKSESSPKRHEYLTTDRFLDLFELRDLGDLPRTEEPQ